MLTVNILCSLHQVYQLCGRGSFYNCNEEEEGTTGEEFPATPTNSVKKHWAPFIGVRISPSLLIVARNLRHILSLDFPS
jgi:hypothetical protein